MVRAYQKATQEGLAASVVIDKKPGRKLTIGTDYVGLGKIQYIIGKENLTILDTVYTDRVEIFLMVPSEMQNKIEKDVIEATSGNARICWGDEVLYATIGNNLKIF